MPTSPGPAKQNSDARADPKRGFTTGRR
uniref:Uncharacterized protein n=1 Tax=Arundo donax TaxID=35708 RepID=A0A0A9G1K4_ARUDO